ncbi:MAG TPA: 30S ribosomal protein S4e [Thermoprotei archaeon]|nr:30S ribosomal protein S4e [Thermoprotei archaeon]
MARKGGRTKLKRLAAPITYKVPRKTGTWVIKTSPGPHPSWRAIPIGVLLRDVLGIAKTLREVKYILRKGYVHVDGRLITNYKFPIGLMDIIEMIPTGEVYRILPAKKYIIHPYRIVDERDKTLKPLRIERKMMVRGGVLQFTTHDSRNFLIKQDDKLSMLKPGDSLVYDIKNKKIIDSIRLESGALALITGGSKISTVAKILEVRKPDPLKPRLVRLHTNEYGVFETVFDYIFPIGTEEPIVKLY